MTVYYLPGTTGWDDFALFTGVPTALWLPAMQTSDGSFGVQNNQFGFNINWASDQTVVVEACTNLSNPDLAAGANQHAHDRLGLFQRSAVDELSRPFLPPALAVIIWFATRFSGRAKAEPEKFGFTPFHPGLNISLTRAARASGVNGF